MKKKKPKPPSYRQGYKDADLMFEQGHSLWFVCSVIFWAGFRRKPDTSSKKLVRYCEGFNDRVENEAKRKGIKLNPDSLHLTMSSEDIGK